MSTVYNPKTETYGDNTTTAVVPPTDNVATAVLEPPKPVRKKRPPKHDFNDGRGRVFAHRHSHGRGWVEDTAYVAEDVYVGPTAQVSHHARVFNGVRLEAKSRISGYATVFNNTHLHNSATISGKAVVSNSRLFDGSHIMGEAEVTNSQLRHVSMVRGTAVVKGSDLRGRVVVFGNVFVVATTAHGFIFIDGSTSVIQSNLFGIVHISNEAHVHGSTIENFSWIWSTSKPSELQEKAEKIRPEYFVRVADHSMLYNNTRLNTPVLVNGRTLLNGCTLSISDPRLNFGDIFRANEPVEAPFERPHIRDAVWRAATIRDRGSLEQLINNTGEAAARAVVPAIRPEQLRAQFSVENLNRGRRVQPI